MHPLFSHPLHLFWRMRRGMTLGVRAMVLDEGGRVFLVRHTYTPGWHFPGGGVEPGETAIDAMARELREEAGIELAGEPELHGFFFNGGVSQRDHVVAYRVTAFEVTSAKRPALEIAEAGFFPVASPPEEATPGTLRRLEELSGGRPISATW